jgi:hypothetical protein
MTASLRQNTLFTAETWTRAYEALQNIDFRAYDQETLLDAMVEYLRIQYPEEHSDWINSSEFVIKLKILAWLSQNISWRVDLNSRENFLATAERRESLIRLAQNIAYSVNRCRPASGEVKVTSIRTNEPVLDSEGNNLANRQIFWNDATGDPDWFERWVLILNSALSSRTPFGRPLRKHASGASTAQVYRLNSLAPATGSYPFSATVGGTGLTFEVINVDLDQVDGTYTEMAPVSGNAFRILYRTDGRGNGSAGTGFFLPIRQGNMGYQDETFTESKSLRTVNINVNNINQDDVWVMEVDENGETLHAWERVDSSFGEGLAFNQMTSRAGKVYEVITRDNDQISVRFGDGKFGDIPLGRFRFWYRTSSPSPRVVRSADIQEKTLTFPYVAGSVVYNLTVTFSLQESLTNASSSESNQDIRTRANKVFYSRNRIVSGEDYNSFFLKDNSILKVKSVNRTYSGHGRSVPLNDPTGAYQALKLIGEDGRIYRTDTEGQETVSANITVLPVDEFIDEHVLPRLATSDKRILYFENYSEIKLTNPAFFTQDSVVNGRSRGRIQRAGIVSPVTQAVGDDALAGDELFHVGPDALLRLTNLAGPMVPVDFVVGDGTANNAVLLKSLVASATPIYSVFPAFRQTLTADERELIKAEVQLKNSFGVRWDVITEKWKIVRAIDLDTSSPFSLSKAGDTTAAGLDASWMLRLTYDPVAGSDDTWTVTHRGQYVYFESDREVDFFYAERNKIFDPENGRVLADSVKILRDNEARDSFKRLGVDPAFSNTHPGAAQQFTGNGTQLEFQLSVAGLSDNDVYVTVNGVGKVPNSDWVLNNSSGLTKVVFVTAPAAGSTVLIRISEKASYATFGKMVQSGDGSAHVYQLTTRQVQAENVWCFENGLFRRPNEHFSIVRQTTFDALDMTTPTPNGQAMVAHILSGMGPAYVTQKYTGDGVGTTFSTGTSTNAPGKIWVFRQGQLRVHGTDYTLDTTDVNDTKVVFGAAVTNGHRIDVRVSLFPTFHEHVDVTYTANGSQTQFDVTGVSGGNATRCMVFRDGTFEPTFSYTVGSPDKVTFSPAPSNGQKIRIIYLRMVGADDAFNIGEISTTVPGLDMEALPIYLEGDITWSIDGKLLHDDGYTNPNGIRIAQGDADGNDAVDDPFMFKDFVNTDGSTDLVLWRRVLERGFEIWEPIGPSTIPRGTYTSLGHAYTEGQSFDPEEIEAGSIHYDSVNDEWLVADGDTETWVKPSDQSLYRWEIGRGGLRFLWTHYSPDSQRIDPSASNIMDVFVLTSGYDGAVRSWIETGGAPGDEPVPASTDALRVQYQEFDEFKVHSDSIVWHSARYRPLFGPQADPSLRAKFKVVRTPGSTLPDNDLKLRVLRAIEDYFAVDLWDFGESFYYTELAAYIHQQLATQVQSVVIVPEADGQFFGRMFQVRCEPDELFVSAATADSIEIVDNLTDSRLKIGAR